MFTILLNYLIKFMFEKYKDFRFLPMGFAFLVFSCTQSHFKASTKSINEGSGQGLCSNNSNFFNSGECFASQITQNSKAQKPPMGFNTYYPSRVQRFQVNQQEIQKISDDMKNLGLVDAGYSLLSIDIGWWFSWNNTPRDSQSYQIIPAPLITDISGMINHIHNNNMTVGVYTDTGSGDKSGCGGFPGSGAFIQQDVEQMVNWGVDMIKVDHCGGSPNAKANNINNVFNGSDYEYELWSKAIVNVANKTGKQLMFSIADWVFDDRTPEWAPRLGNMWRTQSDIDYRVYEEVNGQYVYNSSKSVPVSWNLIMRNFIGNDVPPVAGPGHWNDPDYLLIGGYGLSPTEEQSYFNMWIIQSAPLILATYPADLSAQTAEGQRLRNLLLNKEAIAINQDALGRQGEKVREDWPGILVYGKALSGAGQRAVLLLNDSEYSSSVTVYWGDLGLNSDNVEVRDVVNHKDLGTFSSGFTAENVPPHGSRLLIVNGSDASVILGKGENLNKKILGNPSVAAQNGKEITVALGLDRYYWIHRKIGNSITPWTRIQPNSCNGNVIFFNSPAVNYAYDKALNLVGLGYKDTWGAGPQSVTLFHSYSLDDGATWACFTDLGMPAVGLYGQLAVVSYNSGDDTDILGRGKDNALYIKSWNSSKGWQNWVNEGGCLYSGVSASVRSNNSKDIAIIGCDNKVWHGWYGFGSKVGWDIVPLSGSFSQTPSSHWDKNKDQYHVFATDRESHQIKSIFWPKTSSDFTWGASSTINSCLKSGVSSSGSSPIVITGTVCNTPHTTSDQDSNGDRAFKFYY